MSEANQSLSAAEYCPGWKTTSSSVSGNSGLATRLSTTSPTASRHSSGSQALPASVCMTWASRTRSS